jgi:hypothetical protein
MKRMFPILVTAAALCGCGTGSSLRWMKAGNEIRIQDGSTLQQGDWEKLQHERIRVVFEDRRPYPHDKFGENTETGRVFLTGDDVTAWVAHHWAGMLVGWGFRLVDGGETVRIHAVLEKALVTEGSTFVAEVVVHYKAERPDGTLLWQGTLESRSTRRGRTENIDNYFETLSQAVAYSARDFVNCPPLLAVLR